MFDQRSMTVKTTFMILLAFVLVCFADEPASKREQSPSPEIRKEHQESRDKDGHLVSTLDKTYRGKECILAICSFKTPTGRFANGGSRRVYLVAGKAALFEEDFDGDSIIDEITICREGGCEIYRRNLNGFMEPVSSEELMKQKVAAEVAASMLTSVMERAFTKIGRAHV